MKKHLPRTASIVLGLLFVVASTMFFLKLGPKPDFADGSPVAHFMAAFGPTGYMNFVKIFELVGGLVVMIPRLRNLGLLLLGPVIVNIIAFHALVHEPKQLLNPMLDIIIVCTLYLLWDARKKFAGLLN